MSTSGALSGAASGAAAGSSFGPWGAAVGGAVGLLSGGKDGDNAGNAMSSQERMQQQDLNFRQGVYENEKALTNPQRQRIQGLAMSDQPLYYAENAANINRQFDQGDKQANYLNYGTNLNFGQDTARLQGNALQRRQALAGAYQTGMQNRTNLLAQSAGMGNALGAAQGVGQAYQSGANMYGNWANMYNQAAQSQAANTGQAAGGLAALGGYMQNMNKPVQGSGSQASTTPYDYTNGYAQSTGSSGFGSGW
jgi:hypothetical protein